MADPFVYGGSAFTYKDVPFHNQPYGDVDDTVLVDPSMTILNIDIDPRLQSPSPSSYPNNCWPPPVPACSSSSTLKSAPDSTVFFGHPFHAQAQAHAHASSLRPPVGVTPVHRPSYVRYTSPLSSIEPSCASSGSAFSPPAETESLFDSSYPRSPNDSALLSPFPAPLPLEPYHAVQFASMGPDYVDPHDLNSAQPAEFHDTDNNNISDFFPLSFSFDGGHGGQAGAMVPGPVLDPTHAGLTQEEPSQYPLPSREEDAGSDDEGLLKREADDDCADEDFRPSKRQRPNARGPVRRAAAAAAAAPRPRRGGRATNAATTTTTPSTTAGPSQRALPPASASASSSSRHNLTCPSCSQRGFLSQPDLDAHIKRDHRPFNCVFDFAGCDATFATKNEWKRHAATQHLLLHYWRCTEGNCAALPADNSSSSSSSSSCSSSDSDDPSGPNGAIFNRKDLFTQHLQRMHAPQQVKQHLALAKKSPKSASTTTNTSSSSSAATAALLTSWSARLRHLQSTSMHARCALPTYMLCPVPGCAEPAFRGGDAWNQRMEHVAKHMEQHPGKSGTTTKQQQQQQQQSALGKGKKVVFGGPGDPTLVEWASKPDVAIIVRNPAWTGPGGHGGEDAAGEWTLKSPLKRGPGGCVVVTAPVQQAQQDGVGRQQKGRGRGRGNRAGWEGQGQRGGGEGGEGEEIVVGSVGGMGEVVEEEDEEDEEEDAEGELDV